MKPITFLAIILLIGFVGYTQQIYHLVEKINLPGDGKWDYLMMDDDNNRLFVSHADRVHVVSLTTGKPLAEIGNLSGVHGIALVKEENKGYISNGTTNSVTVFDYTTFKVLKTISLSGKKPDCIMYDKFSNKVYAFCGNSQNAVVIDVKTDTETGTIQLGGSPEFAVSDGKGLIYNNLEDKNEVVVIDTKAGKVIRRYALKKGEAPTGLAIDKTNNRLFTVCSDTKNLLVLDAADGKIVAELPIGGRVDAVIYDKAQQLIVTSNGEGNATFIHQKDADHYNVIQTLQTHPGLRTLVYSKASHNIFISGAELQDKQIKPGTFGVYVYGPEK
jgi:DNA-binding beta-propeller fold protein YncE